MAVSNFSKARKIPTKVTTKKSNPTTTNFAKGIYTYKPNDTMDYDEIYLAQNARFERIGEYKTRLGLHQYTVPVGLETDSNIDTSDYEMVEVTPSTQITLSGGYEYIYDIEVLMALSEPGYNVIKAIITDENENILGVSCSIVGYAHSFNYNSFVFKDGVQMNGTHPRYVRFETQNNDRPKFKIAVIPGTTTVMRSVRKTSNYGQVIGLFEANIQDSSGYATKYLLFAFKDKYDTTTIYRCQIDSYDGQPAEDPIAMRTLPAGVKAVRFLQSGNKIRYADGKEGPRLINPSNNWSDTAITTTDLKSGTDLGIKVSNILDGPNDNIIYFDAETSTQAVWTYPYGFIYNNTPINSYDKFDRDFRQNFPAIETGDPLTAMFNLGGIIYFLTRKAKYYLYMQEADNYSPGTSTAQHGAFSQEACVCDTNYAYYANDDGIYVFDGTSEVSITQNTIQSTYDAIAHKETITLDLYNNRLYVFYSSNPNRSATSGHNDACLVYNINLRLWESFDTGVPVNRTIARKSCSNRFFCGSSMFCQLCTYEGLPNTNESPTNRDYSDLGAPINFDLETSYLHFGTPSQLHRITKWRPEFSKVDYPYDYAVKCGYALDFTDDVKYAFSINLKNRTPIDEHYVWDNPPDYGNKPTPTKLSTIPQVNGQFYRCQIRYQLHSAFTPVNFKSHTLSCETQRLR